MTEKTTFQSGAERSNDRAKVAYHLIRSHQYVCCIAAYCTNTTSLILRIRKDLSGQNRTALKKVIQQCAYYVYLYLDEKDNQAAFIHLECAVIHLAEALAFDNEPHINNTIPSIFFQKVAEAFYEGAVKYKPYNCEKGFPIADVANHLLAHLFKAVEVIDGVSTSDEDDLGHAAWNLCQIMQLAGNSDYKHINHGLREQHPHQ